ncbi:golgin subfamily A member 5-like [Dermacentor albipictus]|uniref:golgin subfamily A member 5-like n=1 Tax=Dermacentor albipictus TaxID=60249 RepID=UPI0038FC58B9
MSWFSDIASRAEDLLTKVDQTAASALQKPLLPNAKTSFMSYTKSPGRSPQPEPSSASPPVSGGFSRSPKPSRGLSLAASSTSVKPKRVEKQASDEKLLEYLNSPEPAPQAPKRSSSQLKIAPESLTEAGDVAGAGESSLSKVQDGTVSQTETVILSEASTTTTTAQGEASTSVAADQAAPGSRRASIQHEELQTSAPSMRSDAPEAVQDSLAEENRMLRKEVSTLNQEMASVLQRVKNADAEKQRLHNRLDHWSSQVSASDSAFRELQARERDLSSALEAKDSQLAVLRVRLQEADQELTAKRRLVDDLRSENQRLTRDQTDLSQVQGKTVETLRDKLAQMEEALRKEQENHRHAQAEFMQRQLKMEEEVSNLSESLTLAQKQLAEHKAHAKESGSQVSSLRSSLELARQELADYKQKAQRILQSKEKLIASLKDAANASGSALDSSEVDGSRFNAASAAELEAVTQECEHLRNELRKTQAHADSLSAELHEQESSLRRELESSQEQQRDLLKELKQERHQRQEADLEARQATEEIAFLKEELRRSKEALQQRLSERELELEKLRKQIMTKSMSSTSEEELEARLHALTESLIQKQTLVEALSTEKNSLVLQLERLERQLKESQTHSPKPHTAIAGFGQPDEYPRARLPGMFVESPFDGTVTRKVKRAYGVIDSLSVRAGLFLRRYPLARIFILIYMGLMHFWVMIVLLTYEPEIHGPHIKQTANAVSKNLT